MRGLFGFLAVFVVVAGVIAAVYMTQQNDQPDMSIEMPAVEAPEMETPELPDAPTPADQ